MQRWVILCLAALTAALTACSPQMGAQYYRNYSTEEMDAYPQAALTYSQDTGAYEYFDLDMAITVVLTHDNENYAMELTLVNKTDEPMVVDWNATVFVDFNGNPHHVIHQDVHFWSPVSTQTPTTIAPDATYRDLLRPAKLVDQDGAVRFAPYADMDLPPDQWWGAQSDILMPIKVRGFVKTYRLTMPD